MSYGFYHHGGYRGLVAVDFWDRAGDVFQYNHPEMPFAKHDLTSPATVRRLAADLGGKCDVLLGGPPCQSFSTLGKRRNGDHRDQLVESFVALCRRVKPKVVVIENVPGIASKAHSSGGSFAEWAADSLKGRRGQEGYDVAAVMLNAIEFGMAQTRVRWVLIGIRRDVNAGGDTLRQVLSGVEDRKSRVRRVLRDVIGDLPVIGAGEGMDETTVGTGRESRPLYNHKAMNHSPKLVDILRRVPPGGGLLDVPRKLLSPHLQRMRDGKYGSGGHVKNVYGRMDWDRPSGTIVAGLDKITCGRFVHPEADRLLTPRECARIQSFPDDFRFYGGMVTQYYLIGNAVPPTLSAVIAASVNDALAGRRTRRVALHPETRSNPRNIRAPVAASTL